VIRDLEYTRARLAQTSERLRRLVHPEARGPDELLVAGPVDRIPLDEARLLEYRPVVDGERFGPLWATYWFRMRATVPEEWAGRPVYLLWDSGSEATLWLDDRAAQGLNRHHADARLVHRAEGGEIVAVEVELACNGLFGRLETPPELQRCELAVFDPEAWRLAHDFETLRALERADGLDPSFAGELRAELERFCDVWPGEEAVEILAALYEHRNASHAHELAAIGHAHLDTAWLWPLAESRRKAVRTFSTQARYLDDYPDYRFACSQAVHYAWIQEREPRLWERVRAHIAEGRWIPVGGSWVEPDCNLPSGEALLRHFVHGQRFFESELGVRCREFWSPDAFGYAGQLPQLLRSVGITRFLTQKLSWNRFNRPEHHTFVWQGVDGSEVLGHFPPADTYNSEATVQDLVQSALAFADHEHSRTSLLVFGHGDGGGGPTRTMLETLRRARDLQGLPRTTMRTSDEFFDALEAEPRERPVVVGELYFEYHRGTYTSQARIKRLNRRCEQALHDAEFLSCVRGGEVPRDELDRLWKTLLLNQFHDILPGSSITLVSAEAERDLAAVEAAADNLCGRGATPVNTIGVARREVAHLPDGALAVVEAPPYGSGVVVEADDEVRLDGLVLENGHLRAELSENGAIASLVEKASGREALAAPGNRLELSDDDPVAFDAWDVDPAHLRTRRDCPPATTWEVVAQTPLRAEIAFERPLGESSRLRQVVRLDAGARRLEVHTTADWRESHRFLKVCFPLSVRAPNATYEMPFGYAERPTHYSTRWDLARYEVPGHRFADLSEHGFGVAVLTDSKYGYSCYGGDLRISLLRAPKSPDPEADMGAHEFAYALVPHSGGWREAGILAEAQRFNAPLRWTDVPAGTGSYAAVDDPNLVLDTVKRAEDSDALVLRLYETHGARGTARLRLAAPVDAACLANGLEEDGEQLEVEDGAIVLVYRPHQLLTVKLR
jgi:alpha-mannosidase